MYLVLGKLVEQVSGREWNEFLRLELLEPLGMKSTTTDSARVQRLENVASPHASDTGKLERLKPYCPDVIAPAGAIHSNVLDIAQWLKFHLEGGQSDDGRQILSVARLAEMHTAPHRAEAESPAEPGVPRAPMSNYGLGWFFNEHVGRRVIEHSGVQNGFVSWIAMMPDDSVGLVILANHHRTGLNSALRSWILDSLLGRSPRDWSEEVRADYASGYQRLLREAKAQYETKHPPDSSPPRPLTEYAGRYSSKLYGELAIAARDDRMSLHFGTRFEGELQHWQNDAFRAIFPNPGLDDWLVTFSISGGKVARLHVKESPWAPAWYDDADDLGDFHRQ
jgi:CubicO group peptidase (beta-lactamase class C family)